MRSLVGELGERNLSMLYACIDVEPLELQQPAFAVSALSTHWCALPVLQDRLVGSPRGLTDGNARSRPTGSGGTGGGQLALGNREADRRPCDWCESYFTPPPPRQNHSVFAPSAMSADGNRQRTFTQQRRIPGIVNRQPHSVVWPAVLGCFIGGAAGFTTQRLHHHAGMAGSGKTTLLQRLNSELHIRKTPGYIINLDPAVLNVPYSPNVDIRDTVRGRCALRTSSTAVMAG